MQSPDRALLVLWPPGPSASPARREHPTEGTPQMYENDTRGRRAAHPDTDGFSRFGGPPFRGRGRGGPFGRGGPRGGRGGGRARRGDVRAAILALLAEKPMHGY